MEDGFLYETDRRFVRGDMDADGEINITDGIATLNFLFVGGSPPRCFDGADANDSGDVDITDAVVLFNWLFIGGEAPPSPSPSSGFYFVKDCGTDPSGDELDCSTIAAKCQ